MFLSKLVISTRHVYTYKCGSEPATYHLKWKYPIILLYFHAQLFQRSETHRPPPCHVVQSHLGPCRNPSTPNRRQSRHIPCLAYRQISSLKNYDKYTFFSRTIIHWNALSAFIHVSLLPTLAQFSNAVCQVVHLSP